ncbi:hypothetical protein HAX54_014733, partial [Datura stramonium]|nr:hypothetical protein [Datura stramonium]
RRRRVVREDEAVRPMSNRGTVMLSAKPSTIWKDYTPTSLGGHVGTLTAGAEHLKKSCESHVNDSAGPILIEGIVGCSKSMGRVKFGPHPTADHIFNKTQVSLSYEVIADPLREEMENLAILSNNQTHAKITENTDKTSYANAVRSCDTLKRGEANSSEVGEMTQNITTGEPSTELERGELTTMEISTI